MYATSFDSSYFNYAAFDDITAPVVSAPTTPNYANASFTVSWTGASDLGGSLIYTCVLQYSDNGGAWTLWVGANCESTSSAPWSAGVSGHTYAFREYATDGAGNTNTSTPSTATNYDTAPPTTPVVTDSGTYATSASVLSASWTNNDTLSLIADHQYCINTSAASTADCATTAAKTWTSTGVAASVTDSSLSLASGATYYFHIKSQDNAGNWSAVGDSDGIIIDNLPPSGGSVSYTNGYQAAPSILVSVSAGSDSVSGFSPNATDYLLEYQSALLTNGTCGTYGSWTDTLVSETAASTSYSYTGSGGNCYQFRYSVKDIAGNTTIFTGTDTTKIDGDAPVSNTISINAAAASTNIAATTLTLSSTDSASGLSLMSFSCDGVLWTTPEAYAVSKSFNITGQTGAQCSALNGTKTVYVQYKDAAGNWSSAVNDTIVYDSIAPISSTASTSVVTGQRYAEDGAGDLLDLAPSGGGITVYPDHISGQIWSVHTGWIDLQPGAGEGVSIEDHGTSSVLAGKAWSEHSGWIDFGPIDGVGGVTIDSSGYFQGTAWSASGFLSFGDSMVGTQSQTQLAEKAVSWAKIDRSAAFVISVTSSSPSCEVMRFSINNASDLGVGLAVSPYSFDGGTNWQAGATKDYAGTSQTIAANQIKVKDALGNTYTHASSINGTAANCNTAPTLTTASSSASYISVSNQSTFPLSCNGITDPDTQTLTVSYSFNSGTNWYTLGTLAAPQTNATLTQNVDFPTVNPVGFAGEGAKAIICKVSDGLATSANSTTLSITKDTAYPTTSGASTGTIGNNSWYTTNVTYTITPADITSGIASTVYCADTANACVPGTAYSSALTLSTEGTNYVRFQSTDIAGNVQPVQSSGIIKIDKTVPVGGSLSYTNGYQTSLPIIVSVNAGTDAISTLSTTNTDYLLEYKSATLSNGTCGTYGSWIDALVSETAGATSYTYTATDATCYQFRYSVKDQAGNASTFTGTDTIKIDMNAPTSNTISINSAAAYTNDAATTLTLSSTDTVSTLSQMQFSCDNTNWTVSEAYAVSKLFNVTNQTNAGCTTAEGTKTVYVKYSDLAGNWTTAVSDTIIYDITAPAAPTLSCTTYTHNTWTDSTSTVCSINDTASPSIRTATAYSTDGGTNWTDNASALNFTFTPAEGTTNVVMRITDTGGQANSNTYTIKRDITAPLFNVTGDITITNQRGTGITGSVTMFTRPSITWTIADTLSGMNTATCAVMVNDTITGSCTTTTSGGTYSPAVAGTKHVLTLTFTDALNHQTQAILTLDYASQNSGLITAPTMNAPELLSENLILWNWTDNSLNEVQFMLMNASNQAEINQMTANTVQYIESVQANTQYLRKVRADNLTHSSTSNTVTVYSLPAKSDVSVSSVDLVNKQATFTSANLGNGKIAYYVYAWASSMNAAPSLTCADITRWTSGSLILTNSTTTPYTLYYLSCNQESAASTEGVMKSSPDLGVNADSMDPELSYLELNYGNAYANAATIPVYVVGYDDVGITEMIITMNPAQTNGVLTGTSKVPFQSFTSSFDTGIMNGTATVYVQLFDAANKHSGIVSKTVTVDAIAVNAPVTISKSSKTGTLLTENTWVPYSAPYFSWSVSPTPASGIAGYSIMIKKTSDINDAFTPDTVIDTQETEYAYGSATLTDGMYILKVKAQNNAGVWSSVGSYVYKVDSTGSAVIASFPQDGMSYSGAAWQAASSTMTGTATDASSGIQSLQYTLKDTFTGNFYNGTDFTATSVTWLTPTGTTTWSIPLTPPDGSYELTMKSRDNTTVVANETVQILNFSLDSTAPQTPSISPATAIKIGSGSITGVYTEIKETLKPIILTEANAKVFVKVNGAASFTQYQAGTNGRFTFSSDVPLTQLQPTVIFYVEDAAGNQSSTLTAYYNYKATLSSITPSSAGVGDTITLVGKNLKTGANPTVQFTGAASPTSIASYAINGSTETITVVVPADAASGSLYVNSTKLIGLTSNTLSFTLLKTPQSISVSPTGNQTLQVGETKVFAAYAKDIDSTTVPSVGYVWHISGLTGTLQGTTLAGNAYSLVLTGGAQTSATVSSVISINVTASGTGTMYVTLPDYPLVDAAPNPAKVITVYSTSTTSASTLACSSSGSIRIDFTSRGTDAPAGIDTLTSGYTTASIETIKAYNNVNPIVKINNYHGVGQVTSEDLYSGTTPIQSVLFTSNATLEGDAGAVYYVSFTNTPAWYPVTPGTALKAPVAGTAVRWRVVMTGTNPILHWVSLKMSTTDNVSQTNIPLGEYVYAEANCSEKNEFQIGLLQKLDSGIESAKIQGNYLIRGNRSSYNDPGPIGIYDGETDVNLLQKYLNIVASP